MRRLAAMNVALFENHARKTGGIRAGLLGVCVAAFVGISVSGAQAEPDSVETRALYNRLEKIERDLIDVQRQTYQASGQASGQAGQLSGATGFGPDPQSAADLSLRLQSVETSLRDLTGRIEKLTYDLTQTQSQFRQFAEDVEFRFQELGASGGASSRLAASSGGPVLTPPASGAISDAAASTVGTLGQVPVSALPQDRSGEGTRVSVNDAARLPTESFSTPAATSTGSAPEDAYEAAINQLKRGQFDVAEAEFANFLQRYPNHNLAGNAQYWLGETFYVRGAYRQAAEAFLTGYSTYSSSTKAPDSLLKLGMTLAALGQQEQACATLGELNRRFPSAAQAVKQRAQLERTRAGC
ncbi:MAG: tol-pal system protein YbgF [Parvibaculum sp.]|nr:tol-pal system protein YbgF [Parvibaculum sp.]